MADKEVETISRKLLAETKTLHPKAIHARHKGGGKFTVEKVGKSVKHLKKGDSITSADLDDHANEGFKIKELKKK